MMMTLSDTYERKINYLRIAVTDRCNLRCVYCMPEGGTHILPREDILTYEELLTITRIVTKIGISKVRITGGEPLIRKGLVEFIYQLSRLPGVEDLSITTNGTLLYKYAEKLYEAGIKRINISLDSLNADRYREITRGGNFADVRRGIEVANEIGFDPLKINTVIIKGVNDDEIKDFALLAVKERFSVRFIEFMPVGEDTYWHEENFVPTYKIKEEIESVARLIPLERTSSSESARIYKPENGYGTIGFISPLTKHFCQYC
ncbi:MAG: GTP 3',8-cyclase MoaA, partial [Thermodesulfobacteriota bacterium]|nr:GTP 3',8-cyclase MoaA [Thermodesulfobacteriota bacterium]